MKKISALLAFILMSSLVQAESFSEEELLEMEEQEKFLEAYAADLEQQTYATVEGETYTVEEIQDVYYEEAQ